MFILFCVDQTITSMSQASRSAVGPVSKVELRVECTGLKKKDEFSKSDPCAVLYLQPRGTNSWSEVLNYSSQSVHRYLYSHD